MDYKPSPDNEREIGFTPTQPPHILKRIKQEKQISALDTQVGGNHYKNFIIQPVEFCEKNKLTHCESNVIKYICRHKFKGKKEDLEKAEHYLKLLIEFEYKDE